MGEPALKIARPETWQMRPPVVLRVVRPEPISAEVVESFASRFLRFGFAAASAVVRWGNVAALALQFEGDSPQREPELDFSKAPPSPDPKFVADMDMAFLQQQKTLAELSGNNGLAQLLEVRIQQLEQDMKRNSGVSKIPLPAGALNMVATAGSSDVTSGGRMSDLELLAKAERGEPEGMAWLQAIAAGKVPETPLVAGLRSLASRVLAPRADNFTPPSRTPWGGTVINFVKRDLGLSQPNAVVGESWEISDHPSFPNRFVLSVGGRPIEVNLKTLGQLFPELLYGRRPTDVAPVGMPYMVKLLNSGSWQESLEALEPLVGSLKGLSYHEIHQRLSQSQDPRVQDIHRQMVTRNLSVQVHPPATDPHLKPGEHSKTEAWAIVDAEPGAGIYLGLRENVTRAQFEDMLRRGQDVTPLLNFVEVKPGDVYFIPSGTMHAIGAGVLLLEPQETSETTYRVFDFGRRDAQGNPRQLHIDRAIAVTQWDGPRGNAALAALRRVPQALPASAGTTARAERLLKEDVFELRRITFSTGTTYGGDARQGVSSFTVLQGTVTVEAAATPQGQFSQGQSFIVPHAVGQYTIRGGGDGPSVVFETAARP